MFIADISFERPDKREGDKFRFVRLGALWYDPPQGEHGAKASALLQAVRVGSFVARPRDQEDCPYMEGDMCVKTGTFEDRGVTKGRHMTVGFIQTKQSEAGTTYFGQILCDPSPIMVLTRVKEMMAGMIAAKASGQHFDLDGFSMNGIFIPIFLSDRKREPTDENLPF